MVHEHMNEFNHTVSEDDIIIAALFHDMGKIGDEDNSYYLNQDSDWHYDRGMFYKLNSDIEYMKVQHRSLYILQHYGIKLNKHVFKAVLLHDGPHDQYNTQYSMKEGLFAILLSHADVLAALHEQKRYIEWEKKNS
jgi:HD superfamily phosphohydrolase YqeK